MQSASKPHHEGGESTEQERLRGVRCLRPIEAHLLRRRFDRPFTEPRNKGRLPCLSESATADEVGLFRSREKGCRSSVPVECVKGQIVR